MSFQEQENASLLASSTYDADAISTPALQHDAEDHDASTLDDRLSDDVTREELEVLNDDYEAEDEDDETIAPVPRRKRGLLGWLRLWRKEQVYEQPMYQRKRPSRRHRERRRRGENVSEAMYEMEEGGELSQSPSRNSSDMELSELKEVHRGMKRRSRKKNTYRRIFLHITIIAFFLLLIFGAYAATKNSRKTKRPVRLVSNGTSLFAPTTLLISLDGFRADFLQRGLTPTLNGFIREGVSPLYMTPPFPSVTFVSHYTMATGLYPETHGIVGNSFWDPAMEEEFFYTQTESSMQPKWWGGEPFWVTAEKAGVNTAIHMYPGSEAHIGGMDPEFFDKFNGDEPLDNKIKRVLGWLDLPGPVSLEKASEAKRPQLIVAYVPNVDSDGHLYGPNSTEITSTIQAADDMLTGIFDGLKARNLIGIVNVVIVSDHGMATTSVDRLIQLDDIIDMEKIAHTDGWPLFGLRPKKDEDIVPLYHQIYAHAQENPYLDVYLRDKDMPEEYHFAKNPRIAPIWVVPKTGWAIVKKSDFDVAKAKAEGLVYHPRGLHGYDYRHPLMRAIFVARGPAFPHQPHSRVQPFANINIYNIICDSLGIEPVPNNGTIRLPFKTDGLHSDDDAPQLETPEDFPDHGPGSSLSAPASAPASTVASPSSVTASAKVTASLTALNVPLATAKPEKGDGEGEEKKNSSIWDWLADSWDELKDRLKGIFGGGEKAR